MLDGSHALVFFPTLNPKYSFFSRGATICLKDTSRPLFTRFGHFDFFSRTGISRIPVFQYSGLTGDRLRLSLCLDPTPRRDVTWQVRGRTADSECRKHYKPLLPRKNAVLAGHELQTANDERNTVATERRAPCQGRLPQAPKTKWARVRSDARRAHQGCRYSD
jgi:hypothetical protein